MRRWFLGLVALTLCEPACGPWKAPPKTSPPSPSFPSIPQYIEAPRWIPDLESQRPYDIEPDGSRLFLTLQMRLRERPDGSIQKAPDLLPAGRSELTVLSLPSRLGGGFLFASATTGQTQLWRAEDWVSPLEPILRIMGRYDTAVAGFDRLYLSGRRSNIATVAVDLASGKLRPLGPLPMPVGKGSMIFADAWRGVVVADLQGPLITFDAGSSWIPIALEDTVSSLALDADRILIHTQKAGNVVAIEADGRLTFETPPPPPTRETPSSAVRRHPLRLAVERGIPLSSSHVLVAEGGKLLEISMQDGSIVRTIADAYPDSYTECQGVRLGTGIGFVCGQRQGATTIYAVDPSYALQAVFQDPAPRAVYSSGNGVLVVRGPCPATAVPTGMQPYCVRGRSGAFRQLLFRGDIGAERVVGMADGKIVVVIAPRPGAEARLVVIEGERTTTKTLYLDTLTPKQRALAQNGLWMQGAIELEPGSVGVWVEGGGPVVGLRIGLDGKVEAGDIQTSGRMLLSGPLGLVWRRDGKGLETTDGGRTWREVVLPFAPLTDEKGRQGCSAVGCAVEGWLRLGWGKSAKTDELQEARTSAQTLYPSSHRYLPLRMVCSPTGRASPAAIPRPASATTLSFPHISASRGWFAFGPMPTPPLSADQVGVAGGRDYGDFRFKSFAWGAKDADWGRVGRWVVAFDDPFDPVGMPVTTMETVSPWSDITLASMYLNAVRTAVLDPAGRSAVLGWCPGRNQCQIFGLTEGRTPLAFGSGAQWLPMVQSAVRSEDQWYLLSGQGGGFVDVHEVDATGNIEKIGTYPRIIHQQFDRLQLVRRVYGPGIALWGTAMDGDGVSRYFALPIDTKTGETMPIQDGGPTDLHGRFPPRCAPGQNGWLVDTQMPVSPRLRLRSGGAFGSSVRLRLRVSGDRICVEAMTGRATEREVGTERLPKGAGSEGVTMAVWDSQSDRKHELVCFADDEPAERDP
ncbi:MAG TPA: hypothetical protein PKL73_19485 [Polyangiaceae bacterium]|jgi:hypothetical protein|nr:hypothetical protein [Polyangiaceae bacterium]HNZ20525.1 hypothetical protein [Polyangiaceae bacterium]HOD23008.1 hypothetical protein [Polyangiaceae bacterium]HOE47279.1 hypothetical protein [Polyangiaceae bacterium]HOG99055.1 hypothetical protein [Polyangiaceae bacterium]